LALFAPFAIMGCDPGLGESVDDLISAAPGICKDYCQEKSDCEWDADGDLKDEAEDDSIDNCIVNCANKMDSGAYIVQRAQDNGGATLEYKEHISGSKLKKYFECLWDKELYDCVEMDVVSIKNYELDISSDNDCEDLQKCAEKLDSEKITDWTWTNNQCVQDDTEPSYLLVNF
jgi:hypothetical protein